MKTEIRIYNLDLIDDIIKLKPDIISIGDDYCPWKLIQINDYMNIASKILDAGIGLRIVTSFLSDSTFEKVLKIINDIKSLSDNIEFVFNDHGLLSYMKNNHTLPSKVIIGQMLNHSFEEYLWSKEMVKEETEKVKNSWLMSNFANKTVIDYFKKNYNLKGIIMNYLPYGQKSGEIFNGNGVEVCFVDKLYTMAVARKCHCAKFNNKEPGNDCEELCNKCFKAGLNQVYQISMDDARFGTPEEDVKNKVQDWIIFGNAIYHEYPDDLIFNAEKYENATIIISQRNYPDIDKIANVINSYRR